MPIYCESLVQEVGSLCQISGGGLCDFLVKDYCTCSHVVHVIMAGTCVGVLYVPYCNIYLMDFGVMVAAGYMLANGDRLYRALG